MTFRSPTFSAFSHGTLTVMSLCRILIVRYSRFLPSTVARLLFHDRSGAVMRIDHLVAHVVQTALPFADRFHAKAPADRNAAGERALKYNENRAKTPLFQGFSLPAARRAAKSLLFMTATIQLEVAVDEVVLLQPAEALPDFLGAVAPTPRPPRAHAARRVRWPRGRSVRHDLVDDRLGHPGYMREDPVAARADAVVIESTSAG